MKKETGLIHIYYGNGKGKTTASIGLCLRAAGCGYRVLIYQFMKDNGSSERRILEGIDNITVMSGLAQEKFSAQMSEREKEERKLFYEEQLHKVMQAAVNNKIDVLFLDEIIYTIRAGLLDEKVLLYYIKKKPVDLELIMTGNTPSDELLELADYVTEIKKVKHPFDRGQRARIGIER